MIDFKVGDKVRYISDNEMDSSYAPPKGTIGNIVEINNALDIILVEWPEESGVPRNAARDAIMWWSCPYDVELVENRMIKLGLTKKEVAEQIKELREQLNDPHICIQAKLTIIADFMKIVEELLEAEI